MAVEETLDSERSQGDFAEGDGAAVHLQSDVTDAERGGRCIGEIDDGSAVQAGANARSFDTDLHQHPFPFAAEGAVGLLVADDAAGGKGGMRVAHIEFVAVSPGILGRKRRAEKNAAVSALLQKILAAELEIGDLKVRQQEARFAPIGMNGPLAD